MSVWAHLRCMILTLALQASYLLSVSAQMQQHRSVGQPDRVLRISLRRSVPAAVVLSPIPVVSALIRTSAIALNFDFICNLLTPSTSTTTALATSLTSLSHITHIARVGRILAIITHRWTRIPIHRPTPEAQLRPVIALRNSADLDRLGLSCVINLIILPIIVAAQPLLRCRSPIQSST